ncbi:MAG: uracil-DNA glycosylase [Gammaproteobacteria bacterium]|nr:uracil-DNA glycosylase [Gammaproteobacteria bacterium]
MDEQRRRHYLAVMGVQNWIPQAVDGVGSKGKATSPEAVVEVSQVLSAEEIPPWIDEVPPVGNERATGSEPDAAIPQGNPVSRLGWDGLSRQVAQCTACDLHAGRQHTVFGVGNREADLMVIGEAPGAEEDRQGEPFVGRAGQLLNAMLGAIGLRREQVYIANILKCRPPGNRDPRPEETLRCAPFLDRQIALVAPRVILTVGRIAAQNLLKSQEAVGRLRGKDAEFEGIPVIVTYHPAYLLRTPAQKARAWQDLQRVRKLLK